jgi:hypothetical protein
MPQALTHGVVKIGAIKFYTEALEDDEENIVVLW